MHTTQTVLASLLMVAVVSAQAEPATSARAQVDRLAAEWQAAQNTYRQALETVQASEAWKAAAAAKDRTEMRALTDAVQKPDAAAFGARALAAAQTFTGDDQMLLLLWAANECGDKQTVETAVGRVIESHLKSPLLGDLLENAMALDGADVAPDRPSDWGSLLADLSRPRESGPQLHVHDRTHLELSFDYNLGASTEDAA